MGINCILSQSLSMQESIYDFTVKDIYGDDFKLSDLKGKKIMIVNTASKCGLTSQYKGLENLYSRYKSCLLYTSPSPRDIPLSRMPSSA